MEQESKGDSEILGSWHRPWREGSAEDGVPGAPPPSPRHCNYQMSNLINCFLSGCSASLSIKWDDNYLLLQLGRTGDYVLKVQLRIGVSAGKRVSWA